MEPKCPFCDKALPAGASDRGLWECPYCHAMVDTGAALGLDAGGSGAEAGKLTEAYLKTDLGPKASGPEPPSG